MHAMGQDDEQKAGSGIAGWFNVAKQHIQEVAEGGTQLKKNGLRLERYFIIQPHLHSSISQDFADLSDEQLKRTAFALKKPDVRQHLQVVPVKDLCKFIGGYLDGLHMVIKNNVLGQHTKWSNLLKNAHDAVNAAMALLGMVHVFFRGSTDYVHKDNTTSDRRHFLTHLNKQNKQLNSFIIANRKIPSLAELQLSVTSTEVSLPVDSARLAFTSVDAVLKFWAAERPLSPLFAFLAASGKRRWCYNFLLTRVLIKR